MITSLPNMLTASRILVIPLFVLALFLDQPVGNWLAFALFSAAGITDFFDGYFARKYGETSALGRFLDPIADKLLVAVALMMLVMNHTLAGLNIVPTLVILCREIAVSGLREFLAEIRVSVPVSRLAKWKTTAQMVAIGTLIVGEAGPDWTMAVGLTCLWVAAVLTGVTAYEYFRVGLRHMVASDEAAAAAKNNTKPS